LLSVENLKTYYYVKAGTVRAVDGVSFELDKGEALGIAGESGCGKTTVALSLLRLVKGGKIVEGRITLGNTLLLDLPKTELCRVRWEKISLIPQAAMGALNPVHRVGDQIAEAIVVHRQVKKAAAWDRARDLLARVQIDPSWARHYPHELSGGMRQRAVIAMALALDPDLVIADEPTTSLDVITQAQTLHLIKRLQKKRNLSILLISHDLSVLAQACDRILIMYAGKGVEIAGARRLYASPRHPYTRSLLSAFPDMRRPRRSLTGLPGRPPDLLSPPTGCRFHPRCREVEKVCRFQEPAMVQVGPDHRAACHLLGGER
jgi:oligopeptide/dipeptide ABC transporter ATP-binding protein